MLVVRGWRLSLAGCAALTFAGLALGCSHERRVEVQVVEENSDYETRRDRVIIRDEHDGTTIEIDQAADEGETEYRAGEVRERQPGEMVVE